MPLKCSTCLGACLGNMPPECLDTRSLLSWRFFNDYHRTWARLVSISPPRRGQCSGYRFRLLSLVLVSHSHSPLVEWLALHVPSSFFHEVVNCLCLPLANSLSTSSSPLVPLKRGARPSGWYFYATIACCFNGHKEIALDGCVFDCLRMRRFPYIGWPLKWSCNLYWKGIHKGCAYNNNDLCSVFERSLT